MTPMITRIVGIAQPLSLLALVAVFVRPNAPWSARARLPVAIAAFLTSAAHLFLTIM